MGCAWLCWLHATAATSASPCPSKSSAPTWPNLVVPAVVAMQDRFSFEAARLPSVSTAIWPVPGGWTWPSPQRASPCTSSLSAETAAEHSRPLDEYREGKLFQVDPEQARKLPMFPRSATRRDVVWHQNGTRDRRSELKRSADQNCRRTRGFAQPVGHGWAAPLLLVSGDDKLRVVSLHWSALTLPSCSRIG